MLIRTATSADRAAIWAILESVIRVGETYTLDRDMPEAEALAYWFAADKAVFVAEADGVILGTYYLRANQAGGGAHVCNCGYMTGAAATGRGVARAMALHSFDAAKVAAFARCSSTSLSRATPARSGCGNLWGSTSSGGCRGRSTIRRGALSMRW